MGPSSCEELSTLFQNVSIESIADACLRGQRNAARTEWVIERVVLKAMPGVDQILARGASHP
jgi:hypothetical protein